MQRKLDVAILVCAEFSIAGTNICPCLDVMYCPKAPGQGPKACPSAPGPATGPRCRITAEHAGFAASRVTLVMKHFYPRPAPGGAAAAAGGRGVGVFNASDGPY